MGISYANNIDACNGLLQDLKLAAQEVSNLCILYDSTYCKDLVSRLEQTTMTVAYREHPQKVSNLAGVLFGAFGGH